MPSSSAPSILSEIHWIACMSIPDSPFCKTFSSACRKISHAYEPDSHSCSALVPMIHLFNVEVIPFLLLSWQPHSIPYISQLLHLPFLHFWWLVPKITQLLLVHDKCLLIVWSAWSSFYPSTHFALNHFLQLPFAWTARTLLPIHFFIPLNFSDDSLVLPYIWNQVYTPCWTMFCLIPYLIIINFIDWPSFSSPYLL